MGEEIDKGSTEPRQVTRLIHLPEVQHRVGLGRSTIYRWMSEGKFPKPVQLGGVDRRVHYAVADESVHDAVALLARGRPHKAYHEQ